MYLLYLDDSGSVKNPGERYFVLAGISVFERQIYHLITSADAYVATIDPVAEAELHGSVMNKGSKSPWKGMPRRDRLAAIEGGLDILRDAHSSVKALPLPLETCDGTSGATRATDSGPTRFAEALESTHDRFRQRWPSGIASEQDVVAYGDSTLR